MPVLESFKNKVAASSCLQHCSFLKKRHQQRCFSVNIAKFLRTRVLKNISEELFHKKASCFCIGPSIKCSYLLTSYELIGKKIDSC